MVSDPIAFDAQNSHHSAVPPALIGRFGRTLEAHALIEGLRRPQQIPRAEHRSFLDGLTEAFEPLGQ